ncbi:FG-GAP repeat domain-containing protein [Candidatus Midichloria mitochondrii]|uniref:FG-GAP repeat domain-containing protein n=1 Tax=Candidatus Midichloria mitochondrii TaxID=234827 RepID=UPI0011D23210|nr:VCBS repeat-containing protein [Candidatus Midichloria mitochondrii]
MFNNYGKQDIADVNRNTNTVSILTGNGNGTFKPAVFYNIGTYPWFLAVAGLDRDGKMDIVNTNSDGNSVALLLGRGDRTFHSAVTIQYWR